MTKSCSAVPRQRAVGEPSGNAASTGSAARSASYDASRPARSTGAVFTGRKPAPSPPPPLQTGIADSEHRIFEGNGL